VIIHGTGGNPQENWFPWLAESVRTRGMDAIAPQFPTPAGQSPRTWLETFDAEVGEVDNRTVLVGHSIGAAFVLRVLEQARRPVGGCVLVSGFLGQIGNDDFDPLNAPFFAEPFDWDAIRENAGTVRLFYGSNDPYVPRAAADLLADGMGSELEVVPEGGHLNSAAGFTEFDAVLDAVLSALREPHATHQSRS
jgi:hypothetical protein